MLRYDQLIQFEPVETVVQLRDANNKDKAFELLSTYVISERMEEQLDEFIFEQIQFDRMVDNKGTLIVGNYGTGKSHLMSVISTIAEQDGASQYIKNKRVAEKAKEIEGKFKVIRTEIGAVEMTLRDIICNVLQKELDKLEIDYTFPKADAVTNNKDMLFEMMDLFHDQYPDQGLLLVVDELLDYLRSRKAQDLTLDLGFLREIGEVCSKSRFRFIAGVQELLFDNPKFQFVADSLRRVKERFQEVRIIREDIAYVVSERLLKKDDKQKALIREHLSKFKPLYHRLSEDMEMFVNLYPIHPAYLETFEKVNIAEKRVVLKTISREIRKLLTETVPENETGFISFDRYWQYIEEDSSLRSNPDVKEIMNKVQTLKDRVKNGLKRPTHKPIALRIVHALAVYRLATDDINVPVGLTSEELRDSLFLGETSLLDMDDDDAGFLKTTIESILGDIMATVSFQYISANKENGQYYIDVKKDIAVDDLIEKRGEDLTNNQMDRYYFEVLAQATEVTDNTYVGGYKIWLHEIPWEARRIKRQGYLFFGAPNERSTAQPERDFYIYMLQPFEVPNFKDEEKPDEVFFILKSKDEQLVRLLRLYGGAREMSNDGAATKRLYNEKANSYLKKLTTWIKENFVQAFDIKYRGKSGSVLDFGMFLPQNTTLINIIDTVSEGLLSQSFEDRFEFYPSFRKLERSFLTKENMSTYISDALAYINGRKTNAGEAILDGLILIDQNKNINVRNSGFAKWVLEKLEGKQGQVVNQNELIETIYTVQGTEDVRLVKEFKMEPELLVVVLAALVHEGEIVITIENKTYEGMNFDELVKVPLRTLTNFSHIKKPSGLPIPSINALIDLFEMGRGNVHDDTWLAFAIKQIVAKSRSEVEKNVKLLNDVRTKFQIWDGPLFSNEEKTKYTDKLESLKSFLEGLQVYNTKAKLTNLKYTPSQIEEQKENLALITQLEQLQAKINDFTKVADYLSKAKFIMSTNRQWLEEVDITLGNLAEALKNNESCVAEVKELERLKEQYIEYYLGLHEKARLNATEENKKQALLQDKQYVALKELATNIDFLSISKQALEEWTKAIQALKTCYRLTRADLQHSPICPYCKFNPREEGMIQQYSLEQLEDRLAELLDAWTEILLTNLNDPVVKESISLLSSEQQKLINKFVSDQHFTLPINIRLLETINDLLKGIHKEVVEIDQMIKMMGDGNPLTVNEVKKNFEMMINALVGNNPSNRVRIMVKK